MGVDFFRLYSIITVSYTHLFYSDFGLFWQVTQGLPNSLYNVASTFDTFIYSSIQNSTPIGRTAAASLFQSVCCCATVLLANFIVSKIDPESAIISGRRKQKWFPIRQSAKRRILCPIPRR